MIQLFKNFINFLLPPRCLLCGKVICTDDSLCLTCFEKINFITRPYCTHCGKPLNTPFDADFDCVECLQKKFPFRLCRSAIEYDENSKKLILDFKFFDHIQNKNLLARWLFMAGKDIFDKGIDIIVPIPLHYKRLLKRKYNQSAVLCAELAKLSHIPTDYKTLKKVKQTIPQVQCSQEQRLVNVRNAFQIVNPTRIKGKRVLLIDDVFTTGSTMRECANTLLKAGAQSVDVLTVARVCK